MRMGELEIKEKTGGIVPILVLSSSQNVCIIFCLCRHFLLLLPVYSLLPWSHTECVVNIKMKP